MKRFEGKNVVITGAAAGIGQATALRIAEEGGNVALIDIKDGIPQGKSLDLMEAGPIRGYNRFITGGTDIAAIAGSQVVVIAAGKSGKWKALLQNFFIGGALLWYPLQWLGVEKGWSGGFWQFWNQLHGTWIGVTLTLAILLTLYSMGDYLWSYRTLGGAKD